MRKQFEETIRQEDRDRYGLVELTEQQLDMVAGGDASKPTPPLKLEDGIAGESQALPKNRAIELH
jgi:hypothetical protein